MSRFTDFLISIAEKPIENIIEVEVVKDLQDLHDSDLTGYIAVINGLHDGFKKAEVWVKKSKVPVIRNLFASLEADIQESADANEITFNA